MRRSARALGLPEVPRGEDLALPAGDRVLRLTLEPDGLHSQVRPLPEGMECERREGIVLPARPEAWPDPGHKRIDRAVQARMERLAGGEAARLDREGRIWESTRSNLFVVGEGALETAEPPSVLPGIARAIVLQAARTLGVRVIHRSPRVRETGLGLEAFATNAVRGLRPVRAIGALRFAGPGPLTRALQRALDVRMGLRPGPPPQGSAGAAR